MLEVYSNTPPIIATAIVIPIPTRAPTLLPTLSERFAAPELEVVEVVVVLVVLVPLRRSAFAWKAAKLFADDSTAFTLNTMPAPQWDEGLVCLQYTYKTKKQTVGEKTWLASHSVEEHKPRQEQYR